MTRLITVRCEKCKATGYEQAFVDEHVDQEKRRCPEPSYHERRKKWERCGGKVDIRVHRSGPNMRWRIRF